MNTDIIVIDNKEKFRSFILVTTMKFLPSIIITIPKKKFNHS